MKKIIILIFIVATVYTMWFAAHYPRALQYIDEAYRYIGDILPAALLHRPVTVTELQTKYNNTTFPKKIRILIAPGHEPNYGGAEYGSLLEREMNVELAQDLAGLLKNNTHYDVMLSRDNDQWNPTLATYFTNHWDEISAFFKESKDERLSMISSGQVKKPVSPIYHNAAPQNVALRLYGINKWENENAVDIAIHIHFNDYPGHVYNSPGEYSGFAVYVPERQYANSSTTKSIADTIFKRLSKYNAASNFPLEGGGLVEEPDLIAIGAYNTTNSASMLIEYGYIYEPQYQDASVRSETFRDLAYQTYLGLQDFFGNTDKNAAYAYDTLMLPHIWKDEISKNKSNTDDVLALQTALTLDGVYPGEGKNKNDCPRTGKYGPCTMSAVDAFQKKYGIKGEAGVVGEKTKGLLNQMFSVKAF